MRIAIILILALGLLAGCGKKGALYLPDPAAQQTSAQQP